MVDDEPDIMRVVEFRLKKGGYEILSAVNGQQGLDLIRVKKPDLVILDLHLPIMDGLEVCRQVRNDAALKTIPIILISASSSKEITQEVKRVGVNEYLLKPFDPQQLLAKIKEYLGDS